jgi:hypothetical protein
MGEFGKDEKDVAYLGGGGGWQILSSGPRI